MVLKDHFVNRQMTLTFEQGLKLNPLYCTPPAAGASLRTGC
jgi:hypothetical protein